jgi:hypothetical protein
MNAFLIAISVHLVRRQVGKSDPNNRRITHEYAGEGRKNKVCALQEDGDKLLRYRLSIGDSHNKQAAKEYSVALRYQTLAESGN